MSSPAKKELGVFAKLTYGSGEFFNATSTVIILMLFLKFLTDVVGLSPYLAGICVIAGKLWDAISDPLIGHISDKTRSRWGRRRVYFLLFSLPAGLSFLSMWVFLTIDSQWGKVAYYALAYITFKTLSSLLNVPYQALGPELATDYDERTSLIVFRMAFSLAGAIVAGVVPNLIVRHFDVIGMSAWGHLALAAGFAAVYLVIWLWIFAKIRENPPQESARKRSRFFVALRRTVRNRAFRVLISIYLCAFLALDILTASTKYFIDEYIQRPELMAVIMGAMLGCALLSLPLYFALIRRFDRRVAFVVGAAVWCVALLGLFTTGPDTPTPLIVAIMVFVGIGVAAAFVVPWSALPEVIDLDVARNGQCEEGVYAGIMTFLRKATTTLAILGISTALGFFGYRSPDELGENGQAPSVLLAIRVFSTLVPAVIVLLGLLITLRYPITKRSQHLIRRKIEAPAELDADETREVEALLDRAYGGK